MGEILRLTVEFRQYLLAILYEKLQYQLTNIRHHAR